MQWNTARVRSLIETLPNIKWVGTSGGEHYVTQQLTYEVAGATDRLYVRGFTTDPKGLPNEDDVDVEMVEITTEYSDGDDSREPANVLARAAIWSELLKAGYSVVRALDPYF
jgi:hypothetical protein